MTITALVPVAEPRTPGYGRAFGRVTVFGAAYGRTVPLAGALVRPYVPGTSTPWPDPLYLDEADATAAVFPVATDASGAVALWADAQGRVELVCEATGYEAQRLVLDLEPPPVVAPPPVDAYTKSESDSRYPLKTDPDPYPGYLTTDEANDLYLPLDYVPPASGISQADADLRYVNTAGDTVTGGLTLMAYTEHYGPQYHYNGTLVMGYPGGTGANLILDGPSGSNRFIQIQTAGSPRWLVYPFGAETGSNAGANLEIHRLSDAGADLGTALSLSRATGVATFGGDVLPATNSTAALGTLTQQFASAHITTLTVTGTAATTDDHATVGAIRLRNHLTSGRIVWRNAANTGNYAFYLSNTDSFLMETSLRMNLDAGFLQVGATSPATVGAVRLRNAANIAWRNAGNTANLTLGVDASNALVFNGAPVLLTAHLDALEARVAALEGATG